MRHLIQTIILTAWAMLALVSCTSAQTTETRDDFKRYYDQFNVEGSFVLYDPQADTYVVYNPDQLDRPFTPASTFKICNSLIGLETGVIADEHFIIPWDSVTRQNPNWNRDHDLKTAFQNSTVWYYQELARRVGGQQMNHWLARAAYGNADTSGGIDRFWLTGGLRITPRQQIDFLKRLYENRLPFSQRSMDIVKRIMIATDTLGHVVSAKTGWGMQDGHDIGWYVGYLETKGKVYYFVNCIRSADPDNTDFAPARIAITQRILADLGLTEK